MSKKHTGKILIDSEYIPFTLRKSKRAKRIIIKIDISGNLELVIPFYSSIKAGTIFLEKQTDWIKKHFTKLDRSKNKYSFLGREIQICENKEMKKDFFFEDEKNILQIKDSDATADAYYKWLRKEAETYLIERTYKIACKINFHPNRISLRNQKNRWGSCTSQKNISLNIKLMQFEPELIDYVIIHELCHLKEMNHSQKFWQLVQSFLPNYKELRKKLRGNI